MKVSFIVENFNNGRRLAQCLSSIYENIGELDADVIVVDNNSTDGSANIVRSEFPQATLIANPADMGRAVAYNKAVKAAAGEIAIIVDGGVKLATGAVKSLVNYMVENTDCGVAGGRIFFPGRVPARTVRRFPCFGSTLLSASGLSAKYAETGLNCAGYGGADFQHAFDADAVSSMFMAVRMSMLAKLGPFDERYFRGFEDVDMCYRAKKALNPRWKVAYLPVAQAELIAGGAAADAPSDLSVMPVADTQAWNNSWVLFIRRQYGFLSLVINVVLAMLCFGVRWLINWIPSKSSGQTRRRMAKNIKELAVALTETAFGGAFPGGA